MYEYLIPAPPSSSAPLAQSSLQPEASPAFWDVRNLSLFYTESMWTGITQQVGGRADGVPGAVNGRQSAGGVQAQGVL